MKLKSCCFESNIQKIDIKEIKPQVEKEIKNLIKNSDVSEFYIRSESNFDKLCIECLQNLKAEFAQIRMNLVLTENLQEIESKNEFLKEFDEIIRLNFEQISARFVKLKQFDWLLEKSDFLISCLENKNIKKPEIIVRGLNGNDLIFFSVRIKLMRLKKGISQAELAKAVNVSPSAIGMYEQGRREPDFLTFLKMCIELNTEPDYVLGLDKKFKLRTVEIDELLAEFIKEIRKNKKVLYDGEIMDNAKREKFAVSFITAFEVAKNNL